MSIRSSGYTADEDIHLCQCYLEISQDPITGNYQSADQFRARVGQKFEETRNPNSEERGKRSMQSRMSTITKSVKHLKACIKQIESMNPSGASDADILRRAKELFIEDSNYKKGFKFDHVWHIIKDMEKFKDDSPSSRQAARKQALRRQHTNDNSSQSDNPTHEYSSSPGLSSFNINLDDSDAADTSSQRPIGVTKPN